MLISPIQNVAYLAQEWTQKRPRISQQHSANPHLYVGFKLKGHNGTDYGVPVGTPVFAPMDGFLKVVETEGGYGLHVRLRNPLKGIEIVLAHLSAVGISDGKFVNMGDEIGLSGNSGYSTGPHLHMGTRRIRQPKIAIPDNQDLLSELGKTIWDWTPLDVNDGYAGYFDDREFVLTWKGTLLKNTR